jgi:hypothetical protein
LVRLLLWLLVLLLLWLLVRLLLWLLVRLLLWLLVLLLSLLSENICRRQSRESECERCNERSEES